MLQLSDYLSSLNTTKKNLMNDFENLEENEKGYIPYIINRLMSNFPDSIFQANLMNQWNQLPKKLQYDYFLHALKPRKRFSKFLKPDKIEYLDIVKEYFDLNDRKAKEVLRILTEEQLQSIQKKMFKGGIKERR